MADRRYETLLLVEPDLGDAGNTETVARVRSLIESQGGTVAQEHDWGLRDLAYEIRKQRRAYYTLFEFRASPDGLAEIERNLKLMEPVMRFQSVRQDENAPPVVPPPEATADGESGVRPSAGAPRNAAVTRPLTISAPWRIWLPAYPGSPIFKTVRATSPFFIATKASLMSSRPPVREIISSSLSRPWR